MEITGVKIFPVDNNDKLKAFVSIIIDNCFIVKDIKIIQGEKGLFLAMPSKKDNKGGYKDIVHPLNSETREMLERTVIDEYNKVTGSTE